MRRNCQREILTSLVPCDPASQILCWLVLGERKRGERERERETEKEREREMERVMEK